MNNYKLTVKPRRTSLRVRHARQRALGYCLALSAFGVWFVLALHLATGVI